MSHSSSFSGGTPKTNKSYILRFTWDAEISDWIIQVNHISNGDSRLFANLEDVFLYIEAQMYQ